MVKDIIKELEKNYNEFDKTYNKLRQKYDEVYEEKREAWSALEDLKQRRIIEKELDVHASEYAKAREKFRESYRKMQQPLCKKLTKILQGKLCFFMYEKPIKFCCIGMFDTVYINNYDGRICYKSKGSEFSFGTIKIAKKEDVEFYDEGENDVVAD